MSAQALAARLVSDHGEAALEAAFAVVTAVAQELASRGAERARKQMQLQLVSRSETAESIVKVVCTHFGCTERQLRGRSRISTIVRPRHIAMALMRTRLDMSLSAVAGEFSDRDHTTVRLACQKEDLSCDHAIQIIDALNEARA